MLRSLRFWSLALCACGLSLVSTLSAQQYATLLSGHQEVPSATTLAEGLLLAEVRGDSVEISGSIFDLSSPIRFDIAGGAHIHTGYAGENGPVTLPIAITYDAASGSATFVDSVYAYDPASGLAEAMASGRAYINVHTELWPGGEVRGQLFNTDADFAFDAMMYGDQQNPPVTTDAMGGIMIEVRTDSMFVTGSFGNLESPLQPVGGTGTHLHTGFHGQNGPVSVSLTPTMSPDNLSGVFERSQNAFAFDADLLTAMNERRVYVNVHSSEYTAGEVRGQVVEFNNNVYFSYVSDVDPQPNPSATAVMRQMAEKVILEDSILVSGSYSGLDAGGLNGNVAFSQFLNPFTGTGQTIFPLFSIPDADPSSGSIPVTSAAVDANGILGLYYRYFTRAGFATGTGTVLLDQDFYHECKRAFYTGFTTSQTVPNSTSTGFGEMITEYCTSRVELNGVVSGLTGDIDASIAGGFHIHEGLAGQTGGIVAPVDFIPLTNGAAILPDAAIINLTSDQAATMRDRGFYYNLHTAQFPSGELRGQIVPRPNAMYHAPIAAGQAVPGFGPSTAAGGILAEVTGDQMTVTGSFNDLVGGFAPSIAGGAHLHGNVAGRTGGIITGLTSLAAAGAASGDFFATDNTFTVSDGLLDSMSQQLVYVNIHSQDRPAGELRGQVTPLASAIVHGKLSPDVTVPYTDMLGMSEGQGHIHGAIFDTTLVLTGSWDSLSTMVDVNVAGGAHMHGATVGETGGILFPIEFTMANNGTSATIGVTENTVELPFASVQPLLDGNVYANVHTMAAQSGAIRGQMLASINNYPNAGTEIVSPADGLQLNLEGLPTSTTTNIIWDSTTDPDGEQDLAYIWQAYTDTTAAPVVQTVASPDTMISLTFGALDTLLASLGVGSGQSATIYHRAWATDGSLLTGGGFSEVTIMRVIDVSTQQLPTGAAQLVNTLTGTEGDLLLDIADLPAGNLTYRVLETSGRVLSEQALVHTGAAQRYTLSTPGVQSGMYLLQLNDESGRTANWMFVVK